MQPLVLGGLSTLLVLALTLPVHAQDSKSAELAKQLAAAMTAAKADSVAAKDPSTPNGYVSALFIPGYSLLTVAGKYSVPEALDMRLVKKEFRDVYMDLQGAISPGSRVFIEDNGANGLQPRREENTPFDSAEMLGKRTAFDSDWKKQNISEDDYMKAYTTADERYAQLLKALLSQVK